MTLRHLLFAPVLALGVILAAGKAFASDLDIELGARVGGGSPSPLLGPNPLAVGVGVRGGVLLRERLYLGAAVTAYFGESAPEEINTGSCNFSDTCPVAKVSAS